MANTNSTACKMWDSFLKLIAYYQKNNNIQQLYPPQY